MRNPSNLVAFISMYDDDNITSSIENEIFQLVYYGKLLYTDVLYDMSYVDRRHWIDMVNRAIKDVKDANSGQHSLSDPNTIRRLANLPQDTNGTNNTQQDIVMANTPQQTMSLGDALQFLPKMDS